ncbi:MAG TPA: nitrogen fixation protein NifH [Dehalococcoidia bacterium]|nr:nitrogen fixation protein NifH [Dehalococcoidia bacterium]
MNNWKSQLKADPTDWLLEESDPGVRYLALRDIVEADQKEVKKAGQIAHSEGPIAEILLNIDEEGFWVKPGAGYFPMYTGTVWAVISLAQLGAVKDMDRRIGKACDYILDHSLTKYGQFTATGTPAGTLDCLQGNLCYSLFDLGCIDPRLDEAYEWMARSVTGEGVAPMTDRTTPIRYYSRDKCGPVFACRGTNSQPCAWGAVKVMLGFGRLPVEKRTPLINRAIQTGVDFLFSKDPATADYPLGYSNKPTGKPSGNWWKFGFPTFMVTDILQNVEALVRLGYGQDPRLANAMNIILDKQDEQGRWPMEYSYAGKTWGDFGPKKQPNKWVTLRTLRVVKQAYS